MAETKKFEIKGNKMLFRKLLHCIHSNKVKKKQESHEVKCSNSSRAQNIGCTATIHLRLECRWLPLNHSLEINIVFTHNHIINAAELLSFWRVDSEVHKEFLKLFNDGYSPSSALHIYENNLHLNASDEQKLLETLADWAKNLGYDYVAKLFKNTMKFLLEEVMEN